MITMHCDHCKIANTLQDILTRAITLHDGQPVDLCTDCYGTVLVCIGRNPQ